MGVIAVCFTINPRNCILNYPDEDKKEYLGEYDAFNQIIRDTALIEGIEIIDLAKEIPSTKNFIYDSAHLNEEGSLLVADILTKFLTKGL